MKATPDLFHLIKSLKQSEKRYFKLFSSIYGNNDGNAVKLFEAIDKQKQFDDDKLWRKLKQTGVKGQLSFHKNYLHQQILKCLQLYHLENGPGITFRNQISQYDILIKKGMLTQAAKLLARSKKKAFERELFRQVLDIIGLEQQVYRRMNDWNTMSDLHQEQEIILNKLKNLNDYENLLIRLISEQQKNVILNSDNRSTWHNEIINDPLMQDSDKARSLSAKVHFYRILGIYYRATGKSDHAFTAAKKLLEFLEHNGFLIEGDPFGYITALQHTIYVSFDKGDYEFYEKQKNKILSLPKDPIFKDIPEIKEKTVLNIYDFELFKFYNTGKFDSGLETIKELNRYLETNRKSISPYGLATINSSMANIYIGLKEYKKALNSLNIILNTGEKIVSPFLFKSARIRAIIVHLELKNREYLEYLIRSTKSYIKRRDQQDELQHELLAFAHTHIKAYDEEFKEVPEKSLWEELHQKVLGIIERSSNSETLLQFDLSLWVQSKCDGKSFGDLLVERTKKAKLPQNGVSNA